MTTYKYNAVSHSGVEITGVVQARDKADAVIRLKDKCRVVYNLKEVEEQPELFSKLKSKKVNEKNLALMCKQFSIILTAGMPIVRTVELVAGQTEDKTLRGILTEVASDVAAGYSLSSSFELRGQGLPSTFIETVRAGETSGELEQSFARLSEYYTKKGRVRGKVVSALTYPAFVIVVAVIVIAVIMIFAVPAFTRTFVTMGTDLPLPTRILIGMSDFFRHWFWLVLVILLAAGFGLRAYSKTKNGSVKTAKFLLKLPLIGKIQLMSGASQFANTLSTMMASGLPAVSALRVTGRAMSNAYLGKSVNDAVERVESGFRIGDSMQRVGVFPELLTEMTAIGEESGSLEETLRVIGEYYDNEVETVTSRAMGLLEPAIICVLAVFVVLVLLAVYLPMFGMYGSI